MDSRRASLSLIVVLMFVTVPVCGSSQQRTQVPFILMVTSRDYAVVKTAVDDALMEVNSGSDFKLFYTQLITTECNDTDYDGREFKRVAANTSPIAIIGAGCSLITEHISQLAKSYNIPLLSYASPSPTLDNIHYNTSGLIRLIHSDSHLSTALGHVLKQYGWSQIAIATQTNSSHYNKTYGQLQRVLTKEGLNVNGYSLMDIFSTNSHIFLLNCEPQYAVELLCQAYHRGLYYPNYLWLTLGWYPTNWWNSTSSTDCTIPQLMTVLERSLSFSSVLSITDHHTLPYYAYDAVHVLAGAVNSTLEYNLTGLYEELIDISFNGKTGLVQFTNTGDRNGTVNILIQQYSASGQSVSVAVYSNQTGFNYIDNFTTATLFPSGVPPDGTPVKVVQTVHYGVFGTAVGLCTVGLILTFVCLLFNILFKNKRIVKLTSPNLNYVIIFGVFFLLIGSLMYCIPTTNYLIQRILCTSRRCLVSVGHDICFTVALVKTWRVHYIFRSPSPKKRAPKDIQLFIIVLIIVSIDVVITSTLFVPDIIYSEVTTKSDPLSPSSDINEQGVAIQYCIVDCTLTNYYLAWLVLTAVFKFSTHVVAIVLAFRIRNIEVVAVNDYKNTSIIIYTSSVLIVILILTILTLSDYVNIAVFMLSFVIFLEVVTFMGLTFIPKMIALYKDPEGKKVFSINRRSRTITGGVGQPSVKKNSGSISIEPPPVGHSPLKNGSNSIHRQIIQEEGLVADNEMSSTNCNTVDAVESNTHL